ncbi:PhzF family phenazine biosynthesis protein [Saccharopolyspora sp. HNM0983]|uniref:PhzF family phenazine biosynthesis protein n=1 Tax=Saccharopolyspora montiporae TaxID=2781240 RepID=A0A929FZR9_9PSEU|nr:PhzF family phenazine biosynthesis protein [Saccharopolyspora sp. HNM0983]
MRACVVDSFADNPFGGNPAGVVLLDAPAEPAWMRSVAAEFKHSETAFVVTGTPGDDPKPLRWFTPTAEVPLCGHATLAAAHVLGGEQRFDTASGVLHCRSTPDGWIELDLPADPPEPAEPPDWLAKALPGVDVLATARSATKLLVLAGSAAQVRAVVPELHVLTGIGGSDVILTAAPDRPEVDFVSRVFAPHVGIPEDPVTGSAHCALAPWWAARLDRTAHGSVLIGEQASARGGTVRAVLRGDRIGLHGRAVTVLDGELRV